MATYTWTIPTGNIITGNTYIKDTDNKIQDTLDDLQDFVNSTGAHTGQGLLFDLVGKDNTQTITGVKTFSNGLIGNLTGNVTGNLTGNVTGTVSGNAGTATKLQTARNIELIGALTGVASFDGSTNVQINTSLAIAPIPTGCIVMWSGSIAAIPSGWLLCNGTNGTPDLRDRFVIGAGSNYAVNAIGGDKDAIVVSHTHTQASHTHTATTDTQGSHSHTYSATVVGGTDAGGGLGTSFSSWLTTSTAGGHTHNITVNSATPSINSTGSSGVDANLPPYYALCFIMKS